MQFPKLIGKHALTKHATLISPSADNDGCGMVQRYKPNDMLQKPPNVR